MGRIFRVGPFRTAGGGDRHLVASGEEATGVCIGFQDTFIAAGEGELAAVGSRLRADLDEVVGGAHDGLVVLDDDDRITQIGEAAEDADEAVHIARVETDRGLVQNEEGIGEGRAEAGGEVDPHGLAAGEGARAAVEG